MFSIRYVDHADEVAAPQLAGFFVGWPDPPTPETHLRLLRASDYVVLAIEDLSGQVVGYITAISDGILSAHIPLLEVLPRYQGHGIGARLVRRMLDRLRHLYAVDLLCDPELMPFYVQFGMQQSTAMLMRNYDRQSGAAGDEQGN